MKNSFTTLAAFVFGILISISIIACADNFDNEDQTAKDDLQNLIEKVTQLTEKISALENETATLKNRVSVLEKSDMLISYKCSDKSSDGWALWSFQYDKEGRISTIEVSEPEGVDCKYSVVYSETGCTITDSWGDSVTLTTNDNNNNTINKIIWSMFANLF